MAGNHKINSGSFYDEYHGHTTHHLEKLHQGFNTEAAVGEKPQFIYLAGDSSFDNKHWFFDGFRSKRGQMSNPSFTAEAVNGYEDILSPPRAVQDIAYHFNNEAQQQLGPKKLVTINAAIEESTIGARNNGLLPQDEFIRDHITEDDILIVSLGGNDVALRPTVTTAVSVGMLSRLPDRMITSSYFSFGMGHMEWLFHDQLENILVQMVSKKKPKKIIVCMIYYLDEKPGGSWADRVLSVLGYDTNPSKVQLIIKTLFERIKHRGFNIEGTEVECFPLFEVLDGKDSSDYCQRVEPSVQGGKKIAKALLEKCLVPLEDKS